jgi:hypothetical protein
MPDPEQPELTSAVRTSHAWQRASSAWMTAVLLAFLVIRILQSQSAHWMSSVLHWWRAF